MSGPYFVQSPKTDEVYEVDATERSNLQARGYKDVTAEHTAARQAEPAAEQPAPADQAPPAEPPAQDRPTGRRSTAQSAGPGGQNTTDTAIA